MSICYNIGPRRYAITYDQGQLAKNIGYNIGPRKYAIT